MVYEWNAAKTNTDDAPSNDIPCFFLDPVAMTFFDPDHSAEEVREITIGYSVRRRVVFLAHCQRVPHPSRVCLSGLGEDRTRIISARKATRRERIQHEEGKSSESV